MNDKLIGRMKKLLAMTESGNEHEAMAATRKLHIMLAKHNVSIEDLSDTSELNLSEDAVELSNYPWKCRVGLSIAKLYFCDFYFSQTRKNYADFVFIGTQENRMFAIHIFKMIVKIIEREARNESRKIYKEVDSRFIVSFWTGACLRICERCKELIQSAKDGTLEDDEGNTLPTLLSTYDQMQINLDVWKSDNLNLKEVSSVIKAKDLNGLAKGKEAGSKVQLTRAIQSKQSPKMLT